MTKAELLKEFDKLQKEKEIRIEGIHCNSNKRTIENAIECLKCPDELLEKYLTVVELSQSPARVTMLPRLLVARNTAGRPSPIIYSIKTI